MIRLAPAWAHHYKEFWRAIRVRNLWFIHLRYLAVIILLGFLISGETFFNFDLTAEQITIIIVVSLTILIYNIVLHLTRNLVSDSPAKFNALHFSLIQITLDLFALMTLVYYTGMNYSPIYMLLIFHMIIGSLILPGVFIYAFAGLVSIAFAVLTYLEHCNILDGHLIKGLVKSLEPHSYSYDFLFVIILTFMLFVSVYIANKIARQLYNRERQLRRILEKLDEAEKAKQKYTIGVVHEIKTPVTAVESIIDLLLHRLAGPIDEGVEKKLLRAKIRSAETLELINDILRFSRLKLLEVTTFEEIDLPGLINSILDNHLEEVKTKDIKLLFKNNHIKNDTILGDRILLELALSNLIGNAVKYSPQESNIEIVIGEESLENIVIEITDDGIGIPQADLDRIFNQFYRASNIDKTKLEGSGMGLAIVSEVIERHSGEIDVKSPSRLAKAGFPGTTFLLRLPYKPKVNPKGGEEINLEDYL
jgi:signal transduction histidine kinase